MKEDFTYCNQTTIIEESVPSSTARLDHWALEMRCVENAWIVPFLEETRDYQGEVITSSGKIIPNVCSGTVYSDGWMDGWSERVCGTGGSYIFGGS